MCGHSFHPRGRKDRVPGGPRVWRNGRVRFSFLAYTLAKNRSVLQVETNELCLFVKGGSGLASKNPVKCTPTTEK